ncbi:MAG: D-2-hydroxyacid dehydrogenase [Chloroflexi bacterium]|nr:D-2-hydroxyacid dehydrogenase [Chloroflexota bacterium]
MIIYTDDMGMDAYEMISSRFPQVDVRIEKMPEEFEEASRGADIICMARKYKRSTVLGAQRLKWLHVGGTGIDRLHPLNELDSELIITNTPGLNAEMMADYVICVMLMLTWDFPRLMRNQLERKWERWAVDRLEGKVLALIGVGNIGRPIADRAVALGMRVIGVKRSPEPVPGVERVAGVDDQLHQTLSEADYVVLALPLTNETRGMIGPREFEAMKENAYLINVCRGKVVQEEALVTALRQGQIRGAALDVFENEPLPPESELWGLKNVIISPHVSSWSKDYRMRAAEIFCVNLERYLSGKPLLHIVDRSRGY